MGADWKEPLIWLAQHESSGNPFAINKTLVGKNKEHATGLMQTLPSTFRAYKMKGYENIFDPVHNLIAAINYIKARYGHPSKAVSGWKKRGGY